MCRKMIRSFNRPNKTDYDQLIAAFKRSYFKQPETIWALAKSLWSETQALNETVLDFVSRIKKLAHQLKADNEQINHAVQAGLQPHLRFKISCVTNGTN
jgi:Retrotransposon gag protein